MWVSASSILLLGPLPQVEHSRLDDESKQVLQGFQSSKEQFRLARVISVSHVKVQYLGEFPKKGKKVTLSWAVLLKKEMAVN